MSEYPSLHMMIGGEMVAGGKRRSFAVVNPATEEVIGALPLAEAADLDRALTHAEAGFQRWRTTPPQKRAAVLNGAAALIRERVDILARNATLEEGKPLEQARLEALSVAALFAFYAGEALRLYGRELARPAGKRAIVRHEPVGPVAAFAPWNFPLSNVGRKLGAPIAAGCSVILKAAEETPASALGLLHCLYDAGLPHDVAQAVFGVPDEVSRHLLASPVIRKLSFTGSTSVGKHLMKLASDNMLRTTMELGGHGPVLVFADADLERALDVMVATKIRNAGQVCVSPTRFIVEEPVFAAFRDGFIARMRKVKLGSGLEDDTQMGPMANPRRPEAMERLVGGAVAAGAKLGTGGERVGNRGFYYAPTVLSDSPLEADIMNEEPFGPVALINSYPDEAAMIAEANRLPYGLAAFAWTQDSARKARLSADIETGMLGLNTVMIAAADSPFGGVKWSGHGSEDGIEGVLACMVTKTVHEEY